VRSTSATSSTSTSTSASRSDASPVNAASRLARLADAERDHCQRVPLALNTSVRPLINVTGFTPEPTRDGAQTMVPYF
jgi:hypothetical protein